MCACVKLRFWPTHRRLVLAGVQHPWRQLMSTMLLPTTATRVLRHFDLFLITKSSRSSGKCASRVGGDPGGKWEGATSTYHQLKVEEGWHLPYQIFVIISTQPSRSQADH